MSAFLSFSDERPSNQRSLTYEVGLRQANALRPLRTATVIQARSVVLHLPQHKRGDPSSLRDHPSSVGVSERYASQACASFFLLRYRQEVLATFVHPAGLSLTFAEPPSP